MYLYVLCLCLGLSVPVNGQNNIFSQFPQLRYSSNTQGPSGIVTSGALPNNVVSNPANNAPSSGNQLVTVSSNTIIPQTSISTQTTNTNTPQQPNTINPQQPNTNIPQQPNTNIPQQTNVNTPQQPNTNTLQQPNTNILQQPNANFLQQPNSIIQQQPGLTQPSNTIYQPAPISTQTAFTNNPQQQSLPQTPNKIYPQQVIPTQTFNSIYAQQPISSQAANAIYPQIQTSNSLYPQQTISSQAANTMYPQQPISPQTSNAIYPQTLPPNAIYPQQPISPQTSNSIYAQQPVFPQTANTVYPQQPQSQTYNSLFRQQPISAQTSNMAWPQPPTSTQTNYPRTPSMGPYVGGYAPTRNTVNFPPYTVMVPRKPATMSSSMWLAQMSTMGRPYSVRHNENPLPDRRTGISSRIRCSDAETIYRTQDGSCNNRNNPTLGQSFRSYKRYIQPHYSDMHCLPRVRGKCKRWPGRNKCYFPFLTSARTISQVVHSESENTESNHTIIFNAWAHFVSHDLSATGVEQTLSPTPCCSQPLTCTTANKVSCVDYCFPIPVVQYPADRYFKSNCMEHVRSLSVNADISIDRPREQLNLVTPFLDASTIYGSDEETLKKLRDVNGRLKTSTGELLPVGRTEDCVTNTAEHCFASGDERVNQSPDLAMIHLAMVKYHNMIAMNLMDTGWEEDKIFQEARKIVSALIQRITYTEFLAEILNPATLQLNGLTEGVYDYEEYTDPRTANVFSSAAFQFIHSLTPSSVTFDGFEIPLIYLFNNQTLLFTDTEKVAIYMSSTAGEKMDRYFSKQLTDQYFQTGQISFDLVAQIIQKGRDHGLPGYTKFRRQCGLPEIHDFRMLSAGYILQSVYSHVDDIDVFVGGMTEDPIPGTLLGPTFTCLVARQFRDTKFGDSHWYETKDSKKGFNEGQLISIKAVTAAKVLCTGMGLSSIPTNPFKLSSESNPMVICADLPGLDFQPWFALATAV